MNWNVFNDTNTTPFRIMVSVGLAVVLVFSCLLFIAFGVRLDDVVLTLLKWLGGFVLVMMGFDVFQWTKKRFSDERYLAAKGDADAKVAAATNAPVSATVNTPSVTVNNSGSETSTVSGVTA